jgi:hypothetical protein
MLALGPTTTERERAMASATIESAPSLRAATATQRQRAELRVVAGGRGLGERQRGRARLLASPRTRAVLRGAAASALIACGYVAVVTAFRALLAFG